MHRRVAGTLPVLFLAVWALLAAPLARAGEVPSSLAGINLGDKAARHKARIRNADQRPVKNAPWVHRVAVAGDKFFSGGYVLVGTCAEPGRVIRIKMRYRDQGLDFFRAVAGDLLRSYGDPAEYKGDFEGRTMGNKWSFTDDRTRPVSLILQHTEGEDPEEGSGTSVKLTNWGMLEAERACWETRHGPAKVTEKTKATAKDNGFLPR